MYVGCSPTHAGRDHAGMDLAFGFTVLDRWKDLGQDTVEKIGCPFLLGDFARRLDPSDFIHHLRTVEHFKPGQCALDLVPMGCTQSILLEADPGCTKDSNLKVLARAVGKLGA